MCAVDLPYLSALCETPWRIKKTSNKAVFLHSSALFAELSYYFTVHSVSNFNYVLFNNLNMYGEEN